MKLWTWQKDGFDITNETTPVDSKNNSPYWNHPVEQERKRFRRVYTTLWEKLGTDQFHWYYCDESEAKDENGYSHEYKNSESVLWEIEIPDEMIWKITCSTVWDVLRGNKASASRAFIESWQRILINKDAPRSSENLEKLKDDFVEFWEKKNENELWDLLFLKEIVPFCSQVLLKHPVDSVTRNPLTEGKWWSLTKPNYIVDRDIQPLPCLQCPGAIG